MSNCSEDNNDDEDNFTLHAEDFTQHEEDFTYLPLKKCKAKDTAGGPSLSVVDAPSCSMVPDGPSLSVVSKGKGSSDKKPTTKPTAAKSGRNCTPPSSSAGKRSQQTVCTSSQAMGCPQVHAEDTAGGPSCSSVSIGLSHSLVVDNPSSSVVDNPSSSSLVNTPSFSLVVDGPSSSSVVSSRKASKLKQAAASIGSRKRILPPRNRADRTAVASTALILDCAQDAGVKESDLEKRITKRIAGAYRRASSKEEEDEECEYLKRMGVLLPNGFKPMTPLFMQAGEDLLKAMDQELE